MASMFSTPKPVGPMPPPPAANPAVLGSAQTALAGQTARKAGAAAEGLGFDSTIKTTSKGLSAPAVARTTLLGG